MNAPLILLIIICVWMEISHKVKTDNILEKAAIAMIVIGAIVELAHKPTSLIYFGMNVYFASLLFKGYVLKRNRRANDWK